jgi:hypothetical protein
MDAPGRHLSPTVMIRSGEVYLGDSAQALGKMTTIGLLCNCHSVSVQFARRARAWLWLEI